MPKQAHEQAAKHFDDASKFHKKAAEHSAAGKYAESADNAIKAKSSSYMGKKSAQDAADAHAKKSTANS